MCRCHLYRQFSCTASDLQWRRQELVRGAEIDTLKTSSPRHRHQDVEGVEGWKIGVTLSPAD